MTKTQLEAKAKKIAKRFFEEAQKLYDDNGMTAEDEIFANLNQAQSCAYDVYRDSA
jgi:hypothetical protein